MLLPREPTSDWLRATSIALALAALVAAALCALLGVGVAAFALVATAVWFALGIVVPRAALPTYHVYAKMLRGIARVVRTVAQLSCFSVVAAAGITTTSMVKERGARQSGWTGKESIATDSYANPFPKPGPPGAGGWARGYARWARATDSDWALGLVPFLALMRSAQETQDHTLRGEIYALY